MQEERLQQSFQSSGKLKERRDQTEQSIKDRVAKEGSIDLTKYEGMDAFKEKFGDTIDASNVDEFAKLRAEQMHGSDEKIKAREEQMMNNLVDKQAEIARVEREKEQYLAGEEIDPSRVLRRGEAQELRREKHRMSLGMSEEEYANTMAAETDKLWETLETGYEGPEYQSDFLTGFDNTNLSAQDIRNAANRRDEESAGGASSQPVNMATNAINQTNVSNTTTVREPVVQNLDPTGSRLSAVPA